MCKSLDTFCFLIALYSLFFTVKKIIPNSILLSLSWFVAIVPQSTIMKKDLPNFSQALHTCSTWNFYRFYGALHHDVSRVDTESEN